MHRARDCCSSGGTARDRIAGLGFAAFGACSLGDRGRAAPAARSSLGGAFAALGLGVGLAGLFRAVPWLYPLLALACVPLRIGVHVGGASSKLLVPLYVVILGAAILLAWELVEGDDARARARARVVAARRVRRRGRASRSRGARTCSEGAIELLAFYVPFTLLALAFARLPWSRLGVRVLYAEVTVMARRLRGRRLLPVRDARHLPEPEGDLRERVRAVLPRQLGVLGSVGVRAVPRARDGPVDRADRAAAGRCGSSLVAAAALVVTWLGLLISFSQSSFAALLVVVIGAAFVAWRWRALVAVVLAVAVLAGISVAQPQVRRSLQHHTSHGLNNATSGRSSLVANGIRIAAHHPRAGCRRGRLQARVR